MRFLHLAAQLAAAAAIFTCSFSPKNELVVQTGQSCSPNSLFVADSGSRAGDNSYSAAFCMVTSGTNSTNWAGVVATGPSFEAAYRGACSMSDRYACQHTDVTLMGKEHFPGLLECSGVRQCVMLDIQETGDPCSSSSECISGMCVNGVCQGRTLGQSCMPGGCAPGYYCEYARGTYTCQANTPAYGGCSSLGQCAVGTICNLGSTQPLCIPLFSQPAGTRVNTPDLCSSGLTDKNNYCTDPAPSTVLGNICDCAATPTTPGTVCACAKDNQCRLREYTFRTPNIVNTRKAARQCFQTARAPDGTICNDPWTNLGAGARSTDLGTCGYLKCHKEIQASYAAMLDNENLPNEYFDQNPANARAVFLAYYTAASKNMIPCNLPSAWRANGWTCNTESPAAASGLSGGAKFGIAVAVLLPLGFLAWAGWALWAGKAPAWLQTAANSVTSLTSRASLSKSGAGAYGQVGGAYAATAPPAATGTGGYGSSAYAPVGTGNAAASASSSLIGGPTSSGYQ